jgi:hypothetical protein
MPKKEKHGVFFLVYLQYIPLILCFSYNDGHRATFPFVKHTLDRHLHTNFLNRRAITMVRSCMQEQLHLPIRLGRVTTDSMGRINAAHQQLSITSGTVVVQHCAHLLQGLEHGQVDMWSLLSALLTWRGLGNLASHLNDSFPT